MARKAPHQRTLASVEELKALGHPLRMRLYYALSAEKQATATQLGEMVDESPASVSYHLRKLADQGFVIEAPELGTDGRQRWWRIPPGGVRWSENDFEQSPEGRAASAAVKRLYVANHWDRQRQYDDESASWGKAWVSAAFSSDDLLRLTSSETTEMHNELRAVIDKYRATSDERTDIDDVDGCEHVIYFMYGFPYKP